MVIRVALVFVLSLAVGACIEPTPVSQCNDAAFKIEAEYTACEMAIPGEVDCESFRGLECDVQPYLDCLVEQVKCGDNGLETGDPASCSDLLTCTLGNGSDSATTSKTTSETTETGEPATDTTG
ncbi:MAG: hypothetical protein ACPG4T_12405 [Nannocystaceae bacterium]